MLEYAMRSSPTGRRWREIITCAPYRFVWRGTSPRTNAYSCQLGHWRPCSLLRLCSFPLSIIPYLCLWCL